MDKVRRENIFIYAERLAEFLASLKMTLIAALFLFIDLIPHIMEHMGKTSKIREFIPFQTSLVTVIISGFPIYFMAIKVLFTHKGISKISSDLLISIAMTAAIAIGDLFAAGEVAFIMAIGAILETATVNKAKKGLKNLLELAPVEARVLKNGREELINAEEVRRGDLIRVLPGEKIPVDAKIVSGETSVDQSIMTGESLPVDKKIGDDVYCGTINRFGSIDIEATKVGDDSSLKQLIRMVQEAEKKQAPIQRLADKWASYLVPASMMTAIITYLFTSNIISSVTILLVFCSCALVLATPTAVMAAIGQASKNGVIIKSGTALETLGKIDAVAFDKTGTLTYGNLAVSDIRSFSKDMNEDDVLRLIASVESKSEHPLGKAVYQEARRKNMDIYEADEFNLVLGRGVLAVVNNRKLICGSESLLNEHGLHLSDGERVHLNKYRSEGKATMLLADEKEVLGVLALADVLRDEAVRVISELNKFGIETVLLTGDNEKAASYFAAKLGIKEIKADLLPEDKVKNIKQLQRAGKRVCMLGDGVNDAPALKTADVSVAMGAMGSDIAVDAADIALMSDDIAKVPYLVSLAAATLKTIKLSISLAMGINLVAVVLSILTILTPTTGALVHNLGSIFVVMIAALLYDRKFE